MPEDGKRPAGVTLLGRMTLVNLLVVTTQITCPDYGRKPKLRMKELCLVSRSPCPGKTQQNNSRLMSAIIDWNFNRSISDHSRLIRNHMTDPLIKKSH